MAIKIHRENALEMEYTFSELQKAAYEQQGHCQQPDLDAIRLMGGLNV